MKPHPNIVIFNPDSYRGDVVRHLGNPGAVTPNLDALLENGGVSYSNAFSQNPVCTPSRCSFMTGWYPHTCGHRSMKNMLKDHEPNLLSVLRNNGYHVWWGGKNDLFAVEQAEDYLKHCDVKYKPGNAVGGYRVNEPIPQDDRRYGEYYRGVSRRQNNKVPPHYGGDHSVSLGAAEFISSYAEEQPFCLFMTLGTPHPPYTVEEDFYNLIDPAALPPRLPVPKRDFPFLESLREGQGAASMQAGDWQELKRVYYAMCAKIDYFLGIVVEALREKGIYDDTLIIFLSDHGDFTGDYDLPEKTHGTLQDCLIRCPFIIKPPKKFGAVPGIRPQLAELIDMTATIYDMLDLEPGYDSYGKSLCANLRGDEREIRNAVFAEVGSRRGEHSFRNLDVVDMPAKSFYAVQGRSALPLHETGSYAISVRTHKHKYIRRAHINHNELYDLAEDPGETNNLSGNPAYATVEREMEILLLNHFMTTGDVMPHKQDSRKV